jgi:hypothetical protein
MANVRNPRKILWSQGSLERRLKKNKTTEEQEAIAIADAFADGRIAELQGQQLQMIQHTFTPSHIYNELIPVGQLHIRRNNDRKIPVLTDSMKYQHQPQLYQYLADRDGTREPYWQETSLVLAEQVNKLKGGSRWAAVRRILGLFNWLGHRSNLTKMYDKQPENNSLLPSAHIVGRRRHNNTA